MRSSLAKSSSPGWSRRRIIASGSAIAAVGCLADWLRFTRAEAAEPEAADDRPRMKGRAPALFIGHGSPMNALRESRFTAALRQWGRDLGLPRAILMVSAHWLTEREIRVSVAGKPETIHDFGGFPPELYAMRYPAPGAALEARAAALKLAPRAVVLDEKYGLDHGAWTVLKYLYPAANVPVFQLSIDITRPAAFHHALGRAIAPLRDAGVLVIGSGNVVHNLRATMRGAADSDEGLAPWAAEFDTRVRLAVDAGDTAALLAYEKLSAGALTAVPFPDHYFPMLYALGAAQAGEKARHVYAGFQGGTLSMRCMQWG
jgi:4,5-DOPA dioxygenase extradiol